MTADFPTSSVTKAQTGLHNTASVVSSTLSGGISGTPSTFEIADGTGFPTANFDVLIETEIIHISSRSGTTLTVGERGHDGTTSADHSNGVTIAVAFCSDHAQKLGDEVKAIEQSLLGEISADLTVDGIFTANSFVGDGSGLTGIASGTGGVTNTGSTTIGADTDADGTGVIALQTRGVTRVQIENLGSITLKQATQDYEISGQGDTFLYLQGKSSGQTTRTRLFAADGDGTDTVGHQIYGVGTPGSLTDSEGVFWQYNSAQRFEIGSFASGTGTVRPLHIYTGSATEQVVLPVSGADGNIGLGNLMSSYNTTRAFPTIGGSVAGLTGLNGDLVLQARPLDSARIHFVTNATPSIIASVTTSGLGIGTTTFGTSAAKVLAIGNGTAPTTSPADAVQLYSADVDGDASGAGLHIRSEQGGVYEIGGVSGKVIFSSATADATAKDFRLAVGHYTNAEEPSAGIFAQSTATANRIVLGGGTSLVNAATEISFYTAANQTTVTGTEVLRIDNAQRVDYRTGSVALGGGASATLGTIGGSGPTTAGQSKWLEVKIAGTTHWIPAWL